MYKLILEYSGVEIVTKHIDKSKVEGLRCLIDLFESELNINIGNCHTSNLKLLSDSATVSITDEELSEWRNRRIDGII
jgi:hypothetical protein